MKSSIYTILLLPVLALSGELDEYTCSFCVSSVEAAREIRAPSSSLLDGCNTLFPQDICFLFKHNNFIINHYDQSAARDVCQYHRICEDVSDEVWRAQQKKHIIQSEPSSEPSLDIRVSKAYGSRGYNNIRLSVISNQTVESEYFTYSKQFQHRWTQYYLNSGIASVKSGEKTKFTIAGEDFEVYMPPQGDGVRGVIIADPCFTSEFIICVYAKKFKMFEHLTELLNAINAHDDVQYWNILGDNFYDQEGDNTGSWFGALSKESKSKVTGFVPGNHDFWINASPKLWTKKDQLGNGFMQFYAQDVAASEVDPTVPFDFSKDPDAPDTNAENLPPASNYFYYNQVGNVGFIGYSGAHTWEESEGYFTEACTWASSTPGISTLLLLGHWNSDGDGCDSEMTVPEVYKSIASLPACEPVASKMRYMLGHKHCNMVMEEGAGFMVGGIGMSDYQCGGDFGIPVVDTTGGSFKVYYFPVQGAWPTDKVDNYNEVLSCITENGVSGCYHLAVEWANEVITE
mmetsp:Transcript_10997/g.16760  ORF Transcript_10997/g.16760 Transcript_10997/m.16760 type:complete len:515 (-) Transcript_10997:175-1719(-)